MGFLVLFELHCFPADVSLTNQVTSTVIMLMITEKTNVFWVWDGTVLWQIREGYYLVCVIKNPTHISRYHLSWRILKDPFLTSQIYTTRGTVGSLALKNIFISSLW